MNTFQPNQVLTARSLCDHDCIYRATVISRTAKTVTIEEHGERKTVKIHTDDPTRGEYCYPHGRYSMCSVFYAPADAPVPAAYDPSLTLPLFIPLKREWFEAFRDGSKTFEYRTYGPRWNEKTCQIGRRVVLSLGYGKQSRLTGEVVSFETCATPQILPGWSACFGDSHFTAAVIGIRIDPTLPEWMEETPIESEMPPESPETGATPSNVVLFAPVAEKPVAVPQREEAAHPAVSRPDYSGRRSYTQQSMLFAEDGLFALR